MSGKVPGNSLSELSSMRKIEQKNLTRTIMKQPELGKKITELRKAKGLTQEELVEKCNINVRTIQRIESGDVTPRSYTVRTILAALEYDINTIAQEEPGMGRRIADRVNRFLLFNDENRQPEDFYKPDLRTAMLAGLIYFVVGFPEAAAEHFRYESDEIIFGKPVYTIIKLVVLLSFMIMQRGFIILGIIHKNYLLRVASYLLIFGNMLIIGYDIASVYYNSIEREFILGAEALTFGGIGIIYGMALFRLKDNIGDAARFAAIFEIIAGIFLITIVLSFIGLILLIPAEILGIVILYKGMMMAGKECPSSDQRTSSLI
jgi:transcriptional regulator with XRE-family HTH domain